MAEPAPLPLREVAAVFLKLGTIAFGGPAAHVGLVREEVVARRHWVSDEEFLDLFGAANAIPGPTSTELCIYLGYRRAGWRGLILAGALFLVPAMLLVVAFAWAYARYGTLPAAESALYGIKPVIIAIVLKALIGLSRSALKNWLSTLVGVAVFALYLAGVNPIALLFGGAALVVVARNARRVLSSHALLVLAAIGAAPGAVVAPAAAPIVAPTLTRLFLVFLKIGAVVYGSGYVLLAFLRTDFVDRLHWLTDRQLIDAIAVGQFTPGPVFTTATFIGYLLGGVTGGVVATIAIFLPSFVFVAAVAPIVPRLRRSPWGASFLDGLNVASLGLITGVTVELGRAALVDPLTVAIAAAAFVVLLRSKMSSVWLILAGAALGIAARALGAVG